MTVPVYWTAQDEPQPTPAFPSLTRIPATGDAVQRVAVPTYFYPAWYTPGSDYNRVAASAPYTETVVLNPASGPGSAVNTDYATAVQRGTVSGLRVLGYVDTNYGNKSLPLMRAEINNWYSWYPGIAGIFLDQMTYEASKVGLCAELFRYIRQRMGYVAINPGIPFIEEPYMDYCDVVMNFEGPPSTYSTAVFPDYVHNYPSRKFWHCIHDVPDTATRDAMLALTKTNRAGYVYLTTGLQSSGNPYGLLPVDPFWSGEVSAVR